MIRQIARWKLLPLLLVGSGNVFVWYRVFVPHGPTLVTASALAGVSVVAGAVTPKRLWWFSTVCLMLPPLFIPNHHGALIFHLLFGFIFPPVWIYFLMNFTPVYVACGVLVLAGCSARRVSAGLMLPTLGRPRYVETDEFLIVSDPTKRLIASGLPFFSAAILGNWMGFMMAAVSPANMPVSTLSFPQILLVPGAVVGMVVSKLLSTDARQLGTAIGNGAIYGLAMFGGRRLYNGLLQIRRKS